MILKHTVRCSFSGPLRRHLARLLDQRPVLKTKFSRHLDLDQRFEIKTTFRSMLIKGFEMTFPAKNK